MGRCFTVREDSPAILDNRQPYFCQTRGNCVWNCVTTCFSPLLSLDVICERSLYYNTTPMCCWTTVYGPLSHQSWGSASCSTICEKYLCNLHRCFSHSITMCSWATVHELAKKNCYWPPSCCYSIATYYVQTVNVNGLLLRWPRSNLDLSQRAKKAFAIGFRLAETPVRCAVGQLCSPDQLLHNVRKNTSAIDFSLAAAPLWCAVGQPSLVR